MTPGECNGGMDTCGDCLISGRDLCDAFHRVLEKMDAHLAYHYANIPLQDREDIRSETVTAVLTGIDGFKGRRGAMFAAWVWSIYRHKIVDYFRRRRVVITDPPMSSPTVAGDEAREDTETRMAILDCLRKHMDGDDSGCLRLYLNLYQCFQTGGTQKDLAAVYRIKPNTLNQRLKRCRLFIRRLFQDCLA